MTREMKGLYVVGGMIVATQILTGILLMLVWLQLRDITAAAVGTQAAVDESLTAFQSFMQRIVDGLPRWWG